MQGIAAVTLNERPVSIARVAEITGYSRGYLYVLVHEKKIPFHKRGAAGGKSRLRFYESEINAWVREGWTFSPAQGDINAEAERIVEGLA
ncbi:MAG: helix-turn-helix domain-containing protein [Treponema sp.]|nr:helix-turn-helix domain-containing protein [Treponema sp.]MBQ6568333.1 helix-turn-helix domain-containing protein [Treponema sp.]MBQ7166153.1 helix-turn-helix domain-containing protein [Treponema sp.]